MGYIALPYSQLAKLLGLRDDLRILKILDGLAGLSHGTVALVIEGPGLPKHEEGWALYNLAPADVRPPRKAK